MANLRILAIGDIVARPGREFVYKNLGRIKTEYGVDFCVVNGENACGNNGINRDIAGELINRGADVITMGNHTFANKEAALVLEDNKRVVRPANYPSETAGTGCVIIDLGHTRVAVINALGRVHMEPVLDCPFRAVDKILDEIKGKAEIVVIDFHAEATSEKLAFGNYFDGRAQVVFGTHTHVQTADERLLPGGTAYITDIGMTGVTDSVLGVRKDLIVGMYLTRQKPKYDKAEGIAQLHGAIIDIDRESGRATGIERIEI